MFQGCGTERQKAQDPAVDGLGGGSVSWRAEDVKEKDRGYKIVKGITINDMGCKQGINDNSGTVGCEELVKMI